LAAEYETIAEAALRDRYAQQVTASGLSNEVAEQITTSPSFPAAVKELRHLEASGCNAGRLLCDAADMVTRASDPADALLRVTVRERISRPMATRPVQRLIAGLIPECATPVAPDMRAALDQRARLINRRAVELAQRAIHDGEARLRDLGPQPTDRNGLHRWRARAITVAAYRDRWSHTGPTAIRLRPASQQERIDAANARRAIPATAPLPSKQTPWRHSGRSSGIGM
jgi:hypothetical protein